MATLDDISKAIAELPAAVASAVLAVLPSQSSTDTAAIEKAITDGFAALTDEIKRTLRGTPPVPAPEPAPAA